MSSFEEDVEVMMLWACWRKLEKKTKREKKNVGQGYFQEKAGEEPIL